MAPSLNTTTWFSSVAGKRWGLDHASECAGQCLGLRSAPWPPSNSPSPDSSPLGPPLPTSLPPYRLRLACGLKALSYITSTSVVAVHNWEPGKVSTGQLLHFYTVQEQADRLAVLRRRSDWNTSLAAEAEQMLQKAYAASPWQHAPTE